MYLYAGTSKQFIEDALQGAIAEKLAIAYGDYFRHKPDLSLYRSWQNSLARICMVLQHASLEQQGIALEYQIPNTSKRIDFLITGRDSELRPNAVLIELKQWSEVHASWVSESVVVYVRGGNRDVLHPSRQVGNYHLHLRDTTEIFEKRDIQVSSCSYLHNIQFDDKSQLFKEQFKTLLNMYPVFTGDQTANLEEYLKARVGNADDDGILNDILNSRYRASKRLLDHVGHVLKREQPFVLLDEQQVAFNAVLDIVTKGFHRRHKVVVLIQGGPGTGKSLIALNLIGEMSARGYNAQYATGSKAFTENVRRIVGSRAAIQFGYFASYQTVERDAIDVLILDEAHRMFASGNNRFTPASKQSDRPLIEHIIEAAKVSVFFIDDNQVVRPTEVGRVSLIRQAAQKLGATLHEFELDAQFRCMGSDAFINWIDNTLAIRQTAQVYWDPADEYDFRILDSIEELESVIREKQNEGWKARLTAGFCWRWSDPKSDGTLVHDVVIGDWSMPWNAKPDSTSLAEGIPKSHFWPTDPAGIDQIGCIYTAQNFEFDYVGVIFGLDLRFDPSSLVWIGDRAKSHDRVVKKSHEQFVDLIKNTYRVLLTRGLRGCFVYFLDPATRDHFKSLTQKN